MLKTVLRHGSTTQDGPSTVSRSSNLSRTDKKDPDDIEEKTNDDNRIIERVNVEIPRSNMTVESSTCTTPLQKRVSNKRVGTNANTMQQNIHARACFCVYARGRFENVLKSTSSKTKCFDNSKTFKLPSYPCLLSNDENAKNNRFLVVQIDPFAIRRILRTVPK